MGLYLFNSEIIEEMINDTFQEKIDKISLEFEVKLKEQILRLLDTNDIEKLIGLKKKIK